MPTVLEAKVPKREVTNSNLAEDLYRNLEGSAVYAAKLHFILPAIHFFYGEEWKWAPQRSETTAFTETISLVWDALDITSSPLMPPMRKFKVKLRVKNIKMGSPSICNDIED